MQKRSFPLPAPVTEAISALEGAGYEAYAVGGCVRDLCRGVLPHDYDITTSATPAEVEAVFLDFRIIETGIKHGTVTVIVGGEPLEITTFRTDGEYLDGRHPASVSFSRSVADDLSRRDFTINAMAYSPTRGLFDPFGGERHIAERAIVCVGEPDRRFGEDGLRIMRALRFASTLGFEIDPETAASIRKNYALLGSISAERILSEYKRMIVGVGAVDILRSFGDVVRFIMPEVSETYDGAVDAIGRADADVSLRTALLISRAENLPALLRLKPDGKLLSSVKRVLRLVGDGFGLDRISLRRVLRGCPYEDVKRAVRARYALCALSVAEADAAISLLSEMEAANECVDVRGLAVTGRDLIALGAPSGESLGEILDHLLEEVVSARLPNDRDVLIAEAEKMINESF